MPRSRYLQLDVFASRAGGGNPLGVVVDARNWDGESMQAFARWTNLVETTFLLPPTDPSADYRVRIFTPSREIPFAGHPSVGSAHAAIEAGVKEVAVFGAASEAFSQKNINCSIAESLARFAPLMEAAREQDIRVRGYVSCVLGCPYEGEVSPAKVAEVARELYAMGCYEVSLGDTIGTGTPGKTRTLFDTVAREVPRERLAGHFHDTYGQALANIYASLLEGIAVFDSSVAGLGGCPYAKGASGNVASEDVLYMFNGLDIATGIDLDALIAAGQRISQLLGRANGSRVARTRQAG